MQLQPSLAQEPKIQLRPQIRMIGRGDMCFFGAGLEAARSNVRQLRCYNFSFKSEAELALEPASQLQSAPAPSIIFN